MSTVYLTRWNGCEGEQPRGTKTKRWVNKERERTTARWPERETDTEMNGPQGPVIPQRARGTSNHRQVDQSAQSQPKATREGLAESTLCGTRLRWQQTAEGPCLPANPVLPGGSRRGLEPQTTTGSLEASDPSTDSLRQEGAADGSFSMTVPSLTLTFSQSSFQKVSWSIYLSLV